jgi:hypothetical protein
MEPRAMREAYLSFQSWFWMFVETNVTTGCITKFPSKFESLIKQQAADWAWPHSSSSSSSEKLITYRPPNISEIRSVLALSMYPLEVLFAFLSISSSANVVQNSKAAAPILLF